MKNRKKILSGLVIIITIAAILINHTGCAVVDDTTGECLSYSSYDDTFATTRRNLVDISLVALVILMAAGHRPRKSKQPISK
ncbi:MAG: hypothetical protein ABIA47_01800 [bacterium]